MGKLGTVHTGLAIEDLKGADVRALRWEARLTLEQCSSVIGMTVFELSGIERNRRSFTRQQLYRFLALVDRRNPVSTEQTC